MVGKERQRREDERWGKDEGRERGRSMDAGYKQGDKTRREGRDSWMEKRGEEEEEAASEARE